MTKLELYNLAFTFLGLDPVGATTERSRYAKLATTLYPVAAKRVLVVNDWQIAVGYKYLTYASNDTNHMEDIYEYMYDTPTDSLKILELGNSVKNARLAEGSYIYTGLHEPAAFTMEIDSVGSSTIVCTASIDTDTFAASDLEVVLADGTLKTYRYTSYATATFSGVTPDPTVAAAAGDVLHSPYDGVLYRYIKDITAEVDNTLVYGDHIALAIAYKMAELMAPSIDRDAVGILRGLYESALQNAIMEDSDESLGEDEGNTWWVDEE